MEEIILIQNNIEKINFLNLFNDHFHDENHLKIGNYIIDHNNLYIHYDNQTKCTFNYKETKNNIKIYNISDISNSDNHNLKIVHETWEDEVILNIENNTLKRLNSDDSGNYILNQNSIIIQWDKYDEETFLLDENTKKYVIQEKKKLNSIYIKNISWEEECFYNINTNILTRNTNNDDKASIIFENNYLIIEWEKWDKELFYFYENQYINNTFFLHNIYLFFDKNKKFYYDKKNIYNDKYYECFIDSKIYEYKKNNNILELYNFNQEKIYELIEIDNVFYDKEKLKKLMILNNEYFIFFDEKIILDLNFIIIGEYNNKEQNILSIHFYNHLKSNDYILNEKNDIFYLEDNFNEIQLYNYDSTILLDNNYLISSNKKQLIIEIEDEYNIFYKINNMYFNQNDYTFLLNCEFDDIIYLFFNDNYKDIIFNIKNNKIIFNQYSFEEKYLFLIDYNILKNELEMNIFQKYGFMFIKEENLIHQYYDDYNILNIKINEDFKKNSVSFLDELKNIKKNNLKLLVFDDFNDYDYFISLIKLDDLKNYILLINYTKSSFLYNIYFYYFFNHLSYLKNITIKKKEIMLNDYNIIEKMYSNYKIFLNNKYDFIIFCIFFYIKNYLNNY